MQNNSPNRKRLLRTEAGLLKRHQLDAHQQQAFIRILEMLVEAVAGLDSRDRQDKRTTETLPPWFDFHRENRVALLEGARGTGKTSVMLSLIHACMQEENREVEPKLGRLRCRTIWLEPLDMEPLPGPTNLLAAILARIGEAIKHYIPQSTTEDGRRGPRGILELCPGYLDALEDLQRLQADAALAWDGNIAERGGHLDPDSYAMEVIRAERARLLLNRNLSNTLNNLAENISSACGVTNPIFVLTVDDLDLNPTRCLEILRLLRMINVPRLFILILGQLNMIESVLDLKYTGDFMKVAGDPGSQCLGDSDLTYIRKNAGTIAYNAMRKLLPPEQRIHLGGMQVWEALSYRPPEPDSNDMPRLHALLAKWPVTIDVIKQGQAMVNGKKIESLWDFLLFPVTHSFQNNEIKKIDIKKCCYNSKEIFRLPPRHIADWWSFLQNIDEPSFGKIENEEEKKKTAEKNKKIKEAWREKKSREFINGFAHYCKSAIGEDPSLSPEHRHQYREALHKSHGTDKWELFLGITSIPETGPNEKLPIPVDGNSPFIKKTFRLCPGKGWRLYPGDSELLTQFQPLPLVETKKLNDELTRLPKQSSFSGKTVSALLFFQDLLALGPNSKLMRKNIMIFRPIELWAKTEWVIGIESVLIFWPVPAFLSYWEYDIFLSYWNVAVAQYLEIDDEKGR